MVGSVLNEGLRGMQLSQREMQKSAHEISRANIPEETQQESVSNPQTVLQPVTEVKESSKKDIGESLIEMRRQEQIFNASAKVVSVANKTLGSLIDVES